MHLYVHDNKGTVQAAGSRGWFSALISGRARQMAQIHVGLDALVARDEGLFASEGLDLQFASPQPGALRSAAEGTLAHLVTNQDRLLERGEARMFQGWSAAALTRVLYSAAVSLLSFFSNKY